MNTFLNHEVIYWDKKIDVSLSHKLIREEPLSIYIQGELHSVVMRTPGYELPHVAGLCLAEGIVNAPDDFASLGFCDKKDTNAITVTLNQSRQNKISHLLKRQGFIGRTDCNPSGKKIVEDLYGEIHPLTNNVETDIKKALYCLENLADNQPLRHKTHSSHAAALYNSDFELLSVAEDVGRHNALDKAIGKLFLNHKLCSASLLILSSRISYELVQKAARAHIPIILAISRPTSLAVELASELNMTLACLAKGCGLYIFCGKHRLER